MEKTFPASRAQKYVLKNPPKINHCLPCREMHTIKNLGNMIVFLWLRDGSGFWYHIHHINGNMLAGHRLVQNQWRYSPVYIKNISHYY